MPGRAKRRKKREKEIELVQPIPDEVFETLRKHVRELPRVEHPYKGGGEDQTKPAI